MMRCYFFGIVLLIATVGGEMLGRFVFHGNQAQDNERSTFSVLHKPQSVHFAPTPGSISSNEIASIISLSIGLSIPKDVTWAGLRVSNPFELPKAVLMLSIDNLPKGSKLNMMSSDSFPVNVVDGATSLSDIYHVSSKYSLSNHVDALLEHRSNIVTVSAVDEVAASGYSSSPLSTTSVWSDQTETWKLVTGDGSVKTSLTKQQILKRIPDVLMSGYTYNEQQQTVAVNVKGLEFSFDLDDKTDFKLFSELVYMLWRYDELESSKGGILDAVPDLYLFSVSALKDLETKYRAESKQIKGALMLIEMFSGKLVKKFVKLYGGEKILVVGLKLASDVAYFDDHKHAIQPVIKRLQDNKEMLVNLDSLTPEIHTVNQLEAAARTKLCEDIQGSVAQFNKFIKFKCTRELPMYRMVKRSLLGIGVSEAAIKVRDLNLSSRYDDTFPVIFNLWFWLVVILALICYATSVAMWNMDPGRDSIIYRLTQQKIKSD